MSVKIVPNSQKECPLIQEIGGYCYCRPNPTTKPAKKTKITDYDRNKIVIDFANYPQYKKLLQSESIQECRQDATKNDNDNEGEENEDDSRAGMSRMKEQPQRHFIEVVVDFGMVPVEVSAYREIHVIDSQNHLNKQQKRIDIHEPEVEAKDHKFDGAFRILLPSSRTSTSFSSSSRFKPEPRTPTTTTTLHAQRHCGSGDAPAPCPPRPKSGSLNKFRIIFKPELPAMHYSEVYYLWVDQHAGVMLKCQGLGVGPNLCFSENVLNFGVQYYNDKNRLKFTMHNHSEAEAYFQFDTDNDRSVFKICPLQGVVQPRTLQTVEVTFFAPKPQTFYKRVVCLMHHQQPQFLELIGMCIPRPFLVLDPIDFCLSSASTKFLPLPSESNSEFFENERHWGIHFSKSFIDFGYRGPQRDDTGKNQASLFQLSSILPYNVMVEWIQDPSGIFTIDPQVALLPAFQSITFEVHFDPKYPETFYSGQLECYILPTDRLWPMLFGPPWIYYEKDQDIPQYQEGTTLEQIPTASESAEHLVTKRSSKDQRRKSSMKKKKSKTSLASTTGQEQAQNSGSTETRVKSKSTSKSKSIAKVSVVEIKVEPPTESNSTVKTTVSSKMTNLIFIDDRLVFPLSFNFNYSGGVCDDGVTFHLLPHELGSPSSMSPVDSNTDLEVSRTSFLYQHDAGANLPKVFQDVWILKGNHNQTHHVPAPPHAPQSLKSVESITSIKLESESEEMPNSKVNEETCPLMEEKPSEMPSELAIPLCLTLRVSGHTFEKHAPVPHFSIPRHITMPPTWPLARVFRSILIKNTSDLPICYDAQMQNEDGEVYRAKPCAGLIQGNRHQIMLISMTPYLLEASHYQHNCNMMFNLTDKTTIAFHGITEQPAMNLLALHGSRASECEILCPETMPGCGSDTLMEFHNPSRFHYRFWFEPATQKDWTVFTPIPTNGMVAPHESVRIIWRFTPNMESTYSIKWCMCLNVFRARDEMKKATPTIYTHDLTLIGAGRNVRLECTPEELDFGSIKVEPRTQPKQLYFVVENPTDVMVHVRLRLFAPSSQDNVQHQMQIKPKNFVLDGRQSRTITVTLRPKIASPEPQIYHVEYALKLTRSGEFDDYKNICDISFIGVDPRPPPPKINTALIEEHVPAMAEQEHPPKKDSVPSQPPFITEVFHGVISEILLDILNSDEFLANLDTLIMGPTPFYNDYKEAAVAKGKVAGHPISDSYESAQEKLGFFHKLPANISGFILQDLILNLVREVANSLHPRRSSSHQRGRKKC